MPNFDLHMNKDSITPLSTAGQAYLRSVLLRGPVYPPRDYQEAVNRGLHVSFENRDTLEKVTDPGSTSAEWKPVTQPENTGYSDDPDYGNDIPETSTDSLPFPEDSRKCDDWEMVDVYPGDDSTLGE